MATVRARENDGAIEALTEMAARTSGVFTFEAALAAGMTTHTLRHAVDRGWIRRLTRGVYRIAGAPETLELQQHIGLAVLGPEAVLSHRAAARIHGFDLTPPDLVEFTVARQQRRRLAIPLTVHTTNTLPRLDVIRVGGWPVTTATRTVIDLARLRLSPRRIAAAIDSAVRNQQSSPITLERRLGEIRSSGRWGVRLIDRLLPDSGGHSPLERRFLELVRESGLPRPRTQVVYRDGKRTFARVDFLFEEAGVVVEVSGWRGHASDDERAKDARRRNELQALGLVVIEFTRADVDERPGYVVGTLRRLLVDPPTVLVG